LLDRTLSPSECEEDANRVRARLGSTIAQLRTNLAPANLVDELARGSGLRDVSPGSALDFAARRHPIPTALIGLGIGLWAYSLARSKSTHGGEAPARRPLRSTGESLARSATNVFRDRAEAKRQQFVAVASSHVKAGATQLSDVIEKSIDDLIGKIPATPATRPLIESAIQMALLAMFEALLPKLR
jgi:hypothetical protein